MKTNWISISSELIHTGCGTFYFLGVWILLQIQWEDTIKFKAGEGHNLTSIFKNHPDLGDGYPSITMCTNISGAPLSLVQRTGCKIHGENTFKFMRKPMTCFCPGTLPPSFPLETKLPGADGEGLPFQVPQRAPPGPSQPLPSLPPLSWFLSPQMSKLL